jgi:hypothetical protein
VLTPGWAVHGVRRSCLAGRRRGDCLHFSRESVGVLGFGGCVGRVGGCPFGVGGLVVRGG